VDKIKYLGIIIDSKFKFNEHVKYIPDRCTKLINALSKSARISWGQRHEALKTIYDGGILPQLLCAAPVWIESINKECDKIKYVREQRIIGLRLAEAYRTISNEALCILTGITPIHIKAQEIATQFNITTGRITLKYQIDKPENTRNWLNPADIVSLHDTKDEGDEHWWNIFTDGQRANKEWDQGLPYSQGRYSRNNLNSSYTTGVQIIRLKHLAIVKTLEVLEKEQDKNNEPDRAIIYTDSKYVQKS
jgi:hypothetical protein